MLPNNTKFEETAMKTKLHFFSSIEWNRGLLLSIYKLCKAIRKFFYLACRFSKGQFMILVSQRHSNYYYYHMWCYQINSFEKKKNQVLISSIQSSEIWESRLSAQWISVVNYL